MYRRGKTAQGRISYDGIRRDLESYCVQCRDETGISMMDKISDGQAKSQSTDHDITLTNRTRQGNTDATAPSLRPMEKSFISYGSQAQERYPASPRRTTPESLARDGESTYPKHVIPHGRNVDEKARF